MAGKQSFFDGVPQRIPFGGLDSDEPLSFKVYDPDRTVLGKRMEDHLRVAVCMWHSFNWPGSDLFGFGTLDRPWLDADDPLAGARSKLEAAFDFFSRLGTPFFTFHDWDVAPEGDTFAQSRDNLAQMLDEIERHMARTGIKLLWGTANLFSHPRYAAGAATNPDPEVFAYAAAQVRQMLEATQRLGGVNYVLWGGREGYDTLLNTDLGREEQQLARFLTLVAEHKHKIGFKGTLLLEPKPQGLNLLVYVLPVLMVAVISVPRSSALRWSSSVTVAEKSSTGTYSRITSPDASGKDSVSWRSLTNVPLALPRSVIMKMPSR